MGKTVTFDQNVSKCKFEFGILLMHHTEKIDGSDRLEFLIVLFDELGGVYVPVGHIWKFDLERSKKHLILE